MKNGISFDTLPLADFSKLDTWVTVSSEVSDSSSSKVSRIGSCEGRDTCSFNAGYVFCITANADVVNLATMIAVRLHDSIMRMA